jgi:hypothetical protein
MVGSGKSSWNDEASQRNFEIANAAGPQGCAADGKRAGNR